MPDRRRVIPSRGGRSATARARSSPSTSQATSCIAIVGSTWAGTTRTRSPTGGALAARGERDVLVAAEPHAGVVDRRVAVVHAERLEPDVGDGVLGADGDHGADDRQRLAERQAELGVGRVHQRVAAGLHLGDAGRGLDVVRAGAAGRDDLAADVVVGGRATAIAASTCSRCLARSSMRHEVALVAHHAADLDALRPGELGEATGVGGVAAAARQADVDVDQAGADAGQRGGVRSSPRCRRRS